jgi:hypothetical protein
MSNPREPHRPCRGDDVEAWLVAEIADCTYEFERGTRNRLAAMLEDYRLHADTGTALLNDVRTNERVTPSTHSDQNVVYVNCDKHGYKQAFNVPGLTSGQHICSDCI